MQQCCDASLSLFLCACIHIYEQKGTGKKWQAVIHRIKPYKLNDGTYKTMQMKNLNRIYEDLWPCLYHNVCACVLSKAGALMWFNIFVMLRCLKYICMQTHTYTHSYIYYCVLKLFITTWQRHNECRQESDAFTFELNIYIQQ